MGMLIFGGCLFSGLYGNFLTFWIDNTLIIIVNWLKNYNSFLKSYSQLLNLFGLFIANPFSSASHLLNDNTALLYLFNDIMMLNVSFNIKIHNENYYYLHLIIKFIRILDNILLSLSVNNLNL